MLVAVVLAGSLVDLGLIEGKTVTKEARSIVSVQLRPVDTYEFNDRHTDVAVTFVDSWGSRLTVECLHMQASDWPPRVKPLKGGRVAFFTSHFISRVNGLCALVAVGGEIRLETNLDEPLFSLLPDYLQKKSLSDNVQIIAASGDRLRVDFRTRQGRDGVKAQFKFDGLRASLVNAYYWRDPTWDGKRTF